MAGIAAGFFNLQRRPLGVSDGEVPVGLEDTKGRPSTCSIRYGGGKGRLKWRDFQQERVGEGSRAR